MNITGSIRELKWFNGLNTLREKIITMVKKTDDNKRGGNWGKRKAEEKLNVGVIGVCGVDEYLVKNRKR